VPTVVIVVSGDITNQGSNGEEPYPVRGSGKWVLVPAAQDARHESHRRRSTRRRDRSALIGRGDRPTGSIHGSRSPVAARRGVIATSQPLASAAGLDVMRRGGNAIDAAVTAAAVLAVVEPTMTGPGGDVFAIVYEAKSKTLRGLNSSGRAGARADADALLARGTTAMPESGARSVTVPGAVAGWSALLERYGHDLARECGCARRGVRARRISGRRDRGRPVARGHRGRLG
jgi:gamma-glutamyltranspeptidase